MFNRISDLLWLALIIVVATIVGAVCGPAIWAALQ